jgi:2OG-Fe(II) oxygenase superfamily
METAIISRADARGPWALDYERLAALAEQWAPTYQHAVPFPHVVLDDLLPDALLDEVVTEFPGTDDDRWAVERSGMQQKLQWGDANRLPPVAASLVALLHAAPFVSFLDRLSGIDGLIGDPHCYHGGLHQSSNGGFLKVHADQPLQPALQLQRRVNVIVFLNRGWLPEWGGELELWDAEMTRCCARIAPVFNRAVIFDTVGSNHGHPDPTTSPPGVFRRSLALYYYVSPNHRSALPDTGVRKSIVQARPGEVLTPQPKRKPALSQRIVRRLRPR